MKRSFFSLLALTLFIFSSCEKGQDIKNDKWKETKDWDGKDKEDKDKSNCFDLVYPISYIMPDGSTITGDEKEVETAIKAWYEANPDSAEKPVLNYPVDIVWEDGATETIENEEAMIDIKEGCEDDESICEWDGSKVADPEVWEEYIVEPLVINEECGGCIVEGVVKYVKIDTDFAYVIYYGKGECDEWAYLVTYYDGDEKKAKKCKFKLDCDPEGN